MPNHVEVHVRIDGPTKDIKALMKLMKSKENVFDFDKVLPMPPELGEVHSGFSKIDGKEVRVWRDVPDGKGGTKAAAIPYEELAAWKKKYGAVNWYDWSIANWGTKWNSYGPPEVSKLRTYCDGKYAEVRYDFQTAWSDPRPVFEKLIELFPTISMEVLCGGEVDEPYGYKLHGASV